jgi:hypothetical protein
MPINFRGLGGGSSGVTSAVDGIDPRSTVYGGIGTDGTADDAAALNAAFAAAGTKPVVLNGGIWRYNSLLTIGVAGTTIIFLNGASLLKGTGLSTQDSIVVTAPSVTLLDFKQNGQRLATSNQTFGIRFASTAIGCVMRRCSVRSNKFHGVQVDTGASVDIYDCDISDNVHSPGAGYGLLSTGTVRAYGNNTFHDNGFCGCYFGPTTSLCHVDGSANRNGAFGFRLLGFKGTSYTLYAENNAAIGVAVEHAADWTFGVITTVDSGRTALGEGDGLSFQGSARCTVVAHNSYRDRGFGIALARRSEVPTATVTSDAGGATIGLTTVAGLPTAGAAVIENEYLTWAGISSLTLTGCTRGQRGTTAVTHPNGRDLLVVPSTTLTADPGTGGTTFPVASTDGFCSGGFLWVGAEICTYDGITSTSFLNVKRGQLNSTITPGVGVAHASGQVVGAFVESHHNTIGTSSYNGYGSTNANPALQISGGASYNHVGTLSVRNATIAVSIGEETWPKSNDYNEVGEVNAENCTYGVFLVTGGNNNRLRKVSALDCWTADPTNISDALFYFDNARANLTSFGTSTVTNNRVDDYEARTISAQPPNNRFSQKNAASGNTAEGRVTATAAWTPPTVADGAGTTTTVTVNGAGVGDTVTVSYSVNLGGGVLLTANVYTANGVLVLLSNRSGAPLTLAAGTLRVDVHKWGN